MIGVGTFKITDKAKKYVNQVLDSERLSYGPFTQKFERVFAASHDCRFAVMSNSGTSSLQVALNVLKNKYGWQDGDEVIVPAVTFIATSNIVIQNNMTPVFVDVDPIYYELDPTLIEKHITSKTRCLIPVHLFGLPCDMDPIMAIAQKYNLRVIEDSCESMFVRYKNRSVGSFGDIGCFSTYIAHILTTGVGGLCTTNSPELAIDIRSLINHGRDSIYMSIDDDQNKSADEMKMIIKKRFSFVQMGYSYRATEMEGALGLAEWERREQMMKVRLENGHYLMNHLAPLDKYIQLPTLRPDSGHAFMMFPIVLRHERKDELVQYLEGRGIETREMLPLINQPFVQKLFPDLKEEDYPTAKWINENGFYIASHQDLSDEEKEYIVKVFFDYFEHKTLTQEKNEACIIVLSKVQRIPSSTSLALFAESLPLELFKDKILIDDSKKINVKKFFEEQYGFQTISGHRGRGHALREAIAKTKCDNIIILGIDGADDPNDIQRILIKLMSGKKMVIAGRFLPGGKRSNVRPFSFHSIGNRFFTFLLNIIYDVNLSDCNNLFRGFKKSSFEQLKLYEEGDNHLFELTVKAIKDNWSIDEIPTIERNSSTDPERKKRNRFLSALSFMRILISQSFNMRKHS